MKYKIVVLKGWTGLVLFGHRFDLNSLFCCIRKCLLRVDKNLLGNEWEKSRREKISKKRIGSVAVINFREYVYI